MGLISYSLDREKRRSNSEVRTDFHYDTADDKFFINRSQDVENILKQNNEMRLADDGYTKERDMKRAARIPMVVVEELMKRGINVFDANHGEALLQALDEPKYSKFKTAFGRLARTTKRTYYRGSTASVRVVPSKGD